MTINDDYRTKLTSDISDIKGKDKMLDNYEHEKQAILNNARYSEKGKSEALAELEKRYKANSRKSIEKLRDDAVKTGLKLKDAQEKRLEQVKQAQEKIDYARLNYQAQAVRDAIMASDNLSDVEVAFREAKQSGNDYAIKAWKDTSKSLIKERFGSDNDYPDFMGELLNDIKSQEVNLAKVEMSQDELEARAKLAELERQATEINDKFGNGQAVINRVFDGIAFSDGKVELEYDYQVNSLTDRKETPSEVAFRLKREREKALAEYQAVLKEKGLDSVIDSDFDDLKDVL